MEAVVGSGGGWKLPFHVETSLKLTRLGAPDEPGVFPDEKPLSNPFAVLRQYHHGSGAAVFDQFMPDRISGEVVCLDVLFDLGEFVFIHSQFK